MWFSRAFGGLESKGAPNKTWGVASFPSQVDDERQCASYRFVGSALQVSSHVAQRAIHDYCSAANRLAVYLVAGEVGAGPTRMAPRELYGPSDMTIPLPAVAPKGTRRANPC